MKTKLSRKLATIPVTGKNRLKKMNSFKPKKASDIKTISSGEALVKKFNESQYDKEHNLDTELVAEYRPNKKKPFHIENKRVGMDYVDLSGEQFKKLFKSVLEKKEMGGFAWEYFYLKDGRIVDENGYEVMSKDTPNFKTVEEADNYLEKEDIRGNVVELYENRPKKARGGLFDFGRPKSAIARDRKYQSQEPHEQKYKRQGTPKHPHYKTKEEGGSMETGGKLNFTTHTGEIVSGKRLTDALNKVADDWVEINKAIRKQDKYAPHVSENQKEENLKKGLQYAEEIRQGEHINNFTIWQRIDTELTGETAPLLPKSYGGSMKHGGKLREVAGTYGGSKTPSTIFVLENRDGSRWYVAEGSVNVNKTYDNIEEGVDIEELSDDDTYTASKPINSLDDLDKFLEDEEYGKGGTINSTELFDEIKKSGKITEQQINLIKNRMNNKKLDAVGEELVQWIWDNTPKLTSEQNEKGINFLRNLWKTPTGAERKNSPFGHREEQALDTFKNFELAGFHNISKYSGRDFYVPIYNVVGKDSSFQYYYDGKVQIIGEKGMKISDKGELNGLYDLRVGLGTESFDEKISRSIRDLFARNNGEIDKDIMDKTISKLGSNFPAYKRVWKNFMTTFEIKEADGKYVNPFMMAKGGVNGKWKLISDEGDKKWFMRDFGSITNDDDKKIPLVLIVEIYDLVSSGAINENELEDKNKPVHVYPNILPKWRFISKKIKKDSDVQGTGEDYTSIISYMGGVPLNMDELTYTFENIKNAEFYWTESKTIQDKLDSYAIMIGFIMDKSVNRMGNTGWDILNYVLGKTDKMFNKGGEMEQGGLFDFGRPKSAISRDRKYQSQEPHEQAYVRKGIPQYYKTKEEGGSMAKGGGTGKDGVDELNMDVPLFIRMLEYAKEDAKTDMDLHKVTENATNLSKSEKTLTMDNYDSIVNTGSSMETGGEVGKNYDIEVIENATLPRRSWRGIVSEETYNHLEEIKNQGGFLRYNIDLYDDKSNQKINKKHQIGLHKFLNEIGVKFSQGGSMEVGGEIKYKGKVITKLHPSGYFEVYSDKQERFIKSDTLKGAKDVVDEDNIKKSGKKRLK